MCVLMRMQCRVTHVRMHLVKTEHYVLGQSH